MPDVEQAHDARASETTLSLLQIKPHWRSVRSARAPNGVPERAARHGGAGITKRRYRASR